MAPSKPHFLILDSPLPGAEIPRLLGRFVFDYNWPLDRSAPDTLPDFVSKYVHEYPEQNSASLTVQSSQSSSVRAKLEQVFSLTTERTSSQRYDITTAKIKTYRLHDQDRAFDALIAVPSVRQQVEALYRRPKQRTTRVYMIVGIKTFVDATVRHERGRGRIYGGEAMVPVGALLGAAGLPPIDTPVGAEWQRDEESGLSSDVTHEGEQVFAIEYRVVKISLLQSVRSAGVSAPRLGEVRTFGWGEGVMAGGGDSDDENEDDDDRLPSLKPSHVKNSEATWLTED